MKYAVLLLLVELLCITTGLTELDNYSLAIEGPPAQEGLPELFYGEPSHPVAAQREVLDSKLPARSLTYQFRLPSGTYDHLRWVGHGIPLPPEVSIRDYGGHAIVTLKTEADSDGFITLPNGIVVLSPPSFFATLRWLLEISLPWVVAVILFFTLRAPLGAATQRLLNKLSNHPGAGIFTGQTVLLTIVALAAVWITLAVPGAMRFDSGDDPAMEILACGDVTGHPSEYLIFINVLIGLVLKSLYLLSTQVPWYPLLVLAVVIFSLAGITLLVLQEDLPYRFYWLCLFGVTFGTYFVTHLQFTSAAYLLGLFGMLIFSQRTSRVSLLAAVILVAAGSLIRFESFLLLLCTTAGSAWLLSKRSLLEKTLFVLAIIVLSWAGSAFDHAYYNRDAGWQAYAAYNKSRGALHADPRLNYGEENLPVYQHVGWSENDYKMFNVHWLYEDTPTFSAAHLTYLVQHLTNDRGALSALAQILLVIISAPAPVLLLIVIFFRATDKPKVSLLIRAVVLGPVIFITIYLAATARLPARVIIPVIYAASLFLLVASRPNGGTYHRITSGLLLPLTFITLTVVSLEYVWMNARQNNLAAARIVDSLNLLSVYPDKTFVSSINAVLLERLNPLTGLAETRNVNMIHLMWSGGSPSLDTQLQRHRSTSLFKSIATDPSFSLIIPTSQWDRADSFSLYMQEHYHQKIKMTPMILSDGRAAVFPDFTVMQAVPEP